jgi:hypothetical protein
MKATTSPDTITIDLPHLLTRRAGVVLMAVGSVLGFVFWINLFTVHIPLLRILNGPAVIIGSIGAVLYAMFWVLKLFGYTK